MVKRLFCFIAICSIYASTFSQNVDYSLFKGNPVKVSIPVRLDQPYFCEYRDSSSNPLRMVYKAGFNSLSTPENILFSAYCGAEGSVSNTPVYNGAKPDTTQRNGLLFIHKLTFFWQGVETAVVKYAEMKDSIVSKPISVQLQHIGSRWKPVNLPDIKYIENAMLSIRTNIFWELYNKRSSEISGINDIKKVVKNEEGLLNIDLLSDFLAKQKESNPTTYKLMCDN